MRHAAARPRPGVQVFEFHAQHRALDAFHAVVEPHFLVVVTLRGPVFAQGTSARGIRRIIRHQPAAFAIGAEVLAWIEAEAGHYAEGPDDFAAILRPVRLRRVFD